MGVVVLEGRGRLGFEEQILRAEALARGHEVAIVGRSELSRAVLQDAALAYGSLRWTREAVQHAGVFLPVHDLSCRG